MVESQPGGHLDGKNFATIGNAGGTRSQASLAGPDTVAGITIGNGQNATGYEFAEVSPGSLSGTVWLDADGDGKMNSGEAGIANVKITLSGTDDLGNAVAANTTTNSSGNYSFETFAPAPTSSSRHNPAGRTQARTCSAPSAATPECRMSSRRSNVPGCDGDGILTTTSASNPAAVLPDQWRHRDDRLLARQNGQALICRPNGGPTATQLGNWMAATFPNLYGSLPARRTRRSPATT